MYQLTCGGFGGKVEMTDFLSAAAAKCGNCGKSVMDVGATPTPEEIKHGPRSIKPVLAISGRQKQVLIGGVLGAFIGAASVPLVGYFGGRLGPPFVGAVAVATLCTLFIFYRAGGFGELVHGLITGNYSGFNLFMWILLVLGAAIGAGIGMTLEEVFTELVVVASLGAFIVGGFLGAVLGPVWANLDKPEKAVEKT